MVQAEIITIGNEILIGQIIDSNSAFLGEELNKIGIDVYQITSISDDEKQILEAIKNAESRVDLVLITGGLGPTSDDITKQTIAKYFEDELVYQPKIYDHIKKVLNKENLNNSNKLQAYLPSKAQLIFNKLGTAPGMCFSVGKKKIVSMPGVPNEMKCIFSQELKPLLIDCFQTKQIIHKHLLLYGIPESDLSEKILKWEEQLPKNIEIAYLPDSKFIKLRITAKGNDFKALENSLEENIGRLKPLISEYLLSDKSSDLEEIIAELLEAKKMTIATAESCTRGELGKSLSSVSGASAYYKGSVIAYAREIKERVLGVEKALIEKETVVSEQVAVSMAKGVLDLYQSDLGISTTGVSGPLKGEDGKKVGTLCLAIVSKDKVFSKEILIANLDRETFVNKGVLMVLKSLLEFIL